MTIFLLLPAGIVRAGESVRSSGVTVLIYHRFGEDRYPTTNVQVAQFRNQLAYLKQHDYRVLPLAELVSLMKKGGPLPSRSVVITIDDGYRSVYEHAWPLLREFDYPFTVFLYTKATDQGHWNYLTWEQVREMQAAGVDFQDHGYAHERMADRPAGMEEKAYRKWLAEDLARSRELITGKLGRRPRFFAVPYGEYNRAVVDIAREAGYEGVFMQDPGSVSGDTDPFFIPREPILGDEWATMDHFVRVLERVDLPITGQVPPPGRLENSVPERFGARLLYPDRYREGTLGIYISELGWRPATLEDGRVSVANDRQLHRRLNRVAISAREKDTGRTAIRFWLLVRE